MRVRGERATATTSGPVIGLTLGASTVSSLPVFLVGALAGEMISALNLTESGIGQLVALCFAVSAGMSFVAGRLVNHIGWLYSLLVSTALVLAAGLSLYLFTPAVGIVAAVLIVGGAANGISHPAANLGLVRSVNPRRLGLAFGMKQAAIPTATLLSGAALPLIAVPFGWQASFLALAVLALLVLLNGLWLVRQVQRGRGSALTMAEEPYDPTHLWYLAVGAGLGAGASNSLGVFLVLHALGVGVSPSVAGVLLAVGGVTNIAARLALGWDADRRTSGHLKRVGILMIVGAGGVLVLSIADGLVMLAIGTVIAFGIGWGYNGLLHHGTMRLYGQAAASVTGKLQASQYIGAVAGPIIVGFVAERSSFSIAWLLVASWMVCGGILLFLFRILWQRRATEAPNPRTPRPE